jgi:NDP-sugar pyrophosphorylase family protein
MRARGISQVPVLDPAGRLVGVHLLREFLGLAARSNWAVLMAGGRGQRLRPLTERIPKPMIPVAGRPILERLVLHLVGAGIRRIFISINYLGHMIREHFGDGRTFGCRIEYLRETTPLGTGGALSLLPERPSEPLLVVNGDLITQVGIDEFLAFHTHGGYAATIGVRDYRLDIPFGVVRTRRNRVTALEEKPSETRRVSAGIYALSPAVLRLIPQRREYPITELFDTCLRRHLPVGAYPIADEWIDVGRHDDLRRARGDT